MKHKLPKQMSLDGRHGKVLCLCKPWCDLGLHQMQVVFPTLVNLSKDGQSKIINFGVFNYPRIDHWLDQRHIGMAQWSTCKV